MRTRFITLALVGLALASGPYPSALGQDTPFTVDKLNEAPPAELSAPIRETLAETGFRLLDGQGKPYIEVWLRKATPAKSAPAGPTGAVLLPFLEVGEVLGAIKFLAEGYDYRDQPIVEDVYTIRYGLQPVNGDHLGVSTFRDYGMLLIASDDKELAPITQDHLDEASSEAAASNHPAVFILMEAPASAAVPSIQHDEAADRWGVVLPLSLAVPEQDTVATHPIQLIFLGHGPI